VDDDSSVLKGLGRLLNVAGFQVKTFSSAEACLAGLNETGFDCVITDLSMGGLDGFDLKARLARLTPNTPVILLTGCGTRATKTRAEHNGFVACLSKPCDASQLLPVIENAVG
jgi:FixJ family two-component response regulator